MANTASSEFVRKLETQWSKGHWVCVGLDSQYDKLPQALRDRHGDDVEGALVEFNLGIIDATHDLVLGYKPNSGFYEPHGEQGLRALERTFAHVQARYPDKVMTLDAKRGDIGNTMNGYDEAVERLRADAVTMNPYLGQDTFEPFLRRTNRGVIVLARTSNPGGGEIQDLPVDLEQLPPAYAEKFGDMRELAEITGKTTVPLYQVVAYRLDRRWNVNGNCGMVVGATYPDELAQVRRIAPEMPILIPAIGAQGGALEESIKAGGSRVILNNARQVVFASSGPDFAQASRQKVIEMNEAVARFMH